MFIALLQYIRPLEEVDKLLEAHRQWLDRYFESGHIVACGRQVPRTGGFIIGRAASREEMISILHEDPFYTGQAAQYEVTELAATRWAEGLEGFKTV